MCALISQCCKVLVKCVILCLFSRQLSYIDQQKDSSNEPEHAAFSLVKFKVRLLGSVSVLVSLVYVS